MMAAPSSDRPLTGAAAAGAGHPWDRAAQGWNRHAAVIRRWLAEATVSMLDAARIGPGARVLDIAAGAGDQSLDIARRVGPQGHVLATDISPAILALAADTARAAGLENIRTRVADAEALHLGGAGFDAAVSRLGLMFCRVPLAALTGAHAALRPGGRFAALVFSQPTHNPCLAIMMEAALRHARRPSASAPMPGTLMSLGAPGLLAQLMHEAGFSDIDVQPIQAPFRVPTSADYVEFVRSAGSPIIEILAPLAAPARREAWNDITTRLEVFATPDGWVGPNELLLCSGTAPG